MAGVEYLPVLDVEERVDYQRGDRLEVGIDLVRILRRVNRFAVPVLYNKPCLIFFIIDGE